MPKPPQQLNFCKFLKLFFICRGSMFLTNQNTRARALIACACVIKREKHKTLIRLNLLYIFVVCKQYLTVYFYYPGGGNSHPLRFTINIQLFNN